MSKRVRRQENESAQHQKLHSDTQQHRGTLSVSISLRSRVICVSLTTMSLDLPYWSSSSLACIGSVVKDATLPEKVQYTTSLKPAVHT